MAISAHFSQPGPNIHSVTITPHLSPAQQSALNALQLAQNEQKQFESHAKKHFQNAVTLAQAGLALAEHARQQRRAALVGDIAAGQDQLQAAEEQERRRIAESFALYQDGVAASSASRGISGPGSSAAQMVVDAQSASDAVAVTRANRVATETTFLRNAIFSAQAEELEFAQGVLASIGDLSALRHQTVAQIHESRARVRSLEQEAQALKNQFLNMNLQEAVGAFQQQQAEKAKDPNKGIHGPAGGFMNIQIGLG